MKFVYSIYIFCLYFYFSFEKVNLAFNIFVHNNRTAQSAGRLLDVLYDENYCFVIHLDKKQEFNVLKENIQKTFNYSYKENIHLISIVKGKWGKIELLDMEIETLNYTYRKCKNDFSHVILLSGDAYTVKDQSFINDFFEKQKGFSLIAFSYQKQINELIEKWLNGTIKEDIKYLIPINKVKKGTAWIAIEPEFLKFVLFDEYPRKVYKYISGARYCHEEFYFPTLSYNSIFDKKCKRVRFLAQEWRDSGAHPNVIDNKRVTIEEIIKKNRCFARKVVSGEIAKIIRDRVGIKTYSEKIILKKKQKEIIKEKKRINFIIFAISLLIIFLLFSIISKFRINDYKRIDKIERKKNNKFKVIEIQKNINKF